MVMNNCLSLEGKKRVETSQKISSQISLNKTYCDAVDNYLLEGVQSATEIAERLIVDQGANKDRFISGKPMIYVMVCQYLDCLQNVKLMEAKEYKSDRIYHFYKE
jgi:hypothetical protein